MKATPVTNDTIQADISKCERCSQDHEAMIFWPLTNSDHGRDLWAFCTEKGEPILISKGDLN